MTAVSVLALAALAVPLASALHALQAEQDWRRRELR